LKGALQFVKGSFDPGKFGLRHKPTCREMRAPQITHHAHQLEAQVPVRGIKQGGLKPAGIAGMNMEGFPGFDPNLVRPFLGARVSLRKRRGEKLEGFSRPFLASAPAFLPGQQENGSERPTNLEMIRICF